MNSYTVHEYLSAFCLMFSAPSLTFSAPSFLASSALPVPQPNQFEPVAFTSSNFFSVSSRASTKTLEAEVLYSPNFRWASWP